MALPSVTHGDRALLTELIKESRDMEQKMLEAAKYYQLLSLAIFVPSIVINSFIGIWMIAVHGPSPFHASANASVLESLDENGLSAEVVQQVREHCQLVQEQGGAHPLVWVDFVVAGLAFCNAILIGIQKTTKPAEKAEVFQVTARKWGAFLRKIAVYKQMTPLHLYNSERIRSFLTNYVVLVENSPMLPRWLLLSSTTSDTAHPNVPVTHQELDGPSGDPPDRPVTPRAPRISLQMPGASFFP